MMPMCVYGNVTELIGNTPLFHPQKFISAHSLKGDLYTKLEYLNPTGSVKDRAALGMLADAEGRGLINKDTVIIEPTSGNTGIGLAAICASRGYRLILTMPESMSIERRKLLHVYGAELVLTPAAEGMSGSVKAAAELHSSIKNSFIPSQFDNPANARAHYDTTAPEIYRDCSGRVDCFVAAFGSAGTITGIAKYLKEKNKDTVIVAVEPAESPLLSKGYAGRHGIQGIGADFIPAGLDRSLIDRVEMATTEEAFSFAKEFCRTEGILVGISSGAALCAACRIASEEEYTGKNIAVLLPDSGDRYLSTPLFE